MYIQKIATILMDDEIHDLILGDSSEQRELQEYIFIDDSNDLDELTNKLRKIHDEGLAEDTEHYYISSTLNEIRQAKNLLEKDEIQSVVFVYQN